MQPLNIMSQSNKPPLKRLYSSVVPSPIRETISRTRRHLPRHVQEMRWRTLGASRLRSEVDLRLDTGPYSWIFILGCNNSGTTLLSELLSAHPLVRTLPKEGQRLTRAIPNSAFYGIGRVFSQRLDLFRWTEASSSECLDRLRYDWAWQFTPGPGYLLEKSPPNTLRSRWLQRYFTPSRFIVLVRHPYAVCEGITRRTTYTIEEAAAHWVLVHQILREDMAHLERCIVIKYEDLCDSPADHLVMLEQFLSLPSPFDPGLLGKSFRSHNMDGTPKPLQNLNARSVKRLSRADLDVINRHVTVQAEHFGYELL
jgi:hypothetical protein